MDLDLLCDTLGWNELHGGKPSDNDGLGEVLQQLRAGVAGQGRVEPGGSQKNLPEMSLRMTLIWLAAVPNSATPCSMTGISTRDSRVPLLSMNSWMLGA